jgi:hypothetical protein
MSTPTRPPSTKRILPLTFASGDLRNLAAFLTEAAASCGEGGGIADKPFLLADGAAFT